MHTAEFLELRCCGEPTDILNRTDEPCRYHGAEATHFFVKHFVYRKLLHGFGELFNRRGLLALKCDENPIIRFTEVKDFLKRPFRIPTIWIAEDFPDKTL